jgi:hypothetical protein
MDQQDWKDYEDYCERCARQAKTPVSFPVWDKMTRGLSSYMGKELAPAAVPAPSEPATQPAQSTASAGEGDASVVIGIERRIMKSGDVRFLEGINEPMGIETARYINNLSIELHNTQKVAEAFASTTNDSGYSELIDELSGQIKRLERENAAAKAALAEIIYLAPDKQPADLLGTSTIVREAYKLGYEWAQWEDAQIARKATAA